MKLLKSILTSTLLLCALFIGQAQAYWLNTQTGQIPTNSVTIVGNHTYVNAQYIKASNGTWWGVSMDCVAGACSLTPSVASTPSTYDPLHNPYYVESTYNVATNQMVIADAIGPGTTASGLFYITYNNIYQAAFTCNLGNMTCVTNSASQGAWVLGNPI